VYAARIILQFEHVDSFRFKHALCFDRRFALTSPEYRSSSSPSCTLYFQQPFNGSFRAQSETRARNTVVPGNSNPRFEHTSRFLFPTEGPFVHGARIIANYRAINNTGLVGFDSESRKTNPPRSKFERKINVEFLCCRRRVRHGRIFSRECLIHSSN